MQQRQVINVSEGIPIQAQRHTALDNSCIARLQHIIQRHVS